MFPTDIAAKKFLIPKGKPNALTNRREKRSFLWPMF